MDSDRKKESDTVSSSKEDVQNYLVKKGYFCWLTAYREVENYIPYYTFRAAVDEAHRDKTKIRLPMSPFTNRCKIEYSGTDSPYKQNVMLSRSLLDNIQHNNRVTTKNIDCKTLRREIEKAVKNSKRSTFSIDKIRVAKAVVAKKPQLENKELQDTISSLVKHIRAANGVSNNL